MKKFSQVEATLVKVKRLASDSDQNYEIFDEFIDACLNGYVDGLKAQQLSILFRSLNEIETDLKERGLSTDAVTGARETILFVLHNSGR